MNKYQEALNNIDDCRHIVNDSDYGSSEPHLFNKALVTLQELVDKETPMKPIRIGEQDNIFSDTCRNCKDPIVFINNYLTPKRCIECGQKIDWTDEDE